MAKKSTETNKATKITRAKIAKVQKRAVQTNKVVKKPSLHAKAMKIDNSALKNEPPVIKLSNLEQAIHKLAPLADSEALIQLEDAEIKSLAKKSGLSQRRVQVLVDSTRLSKETGISRDIFYALGNAKLPLNLSRLLTHDSAELRTTLDNSVKNKIIPTLSTEMIAKTVQDIENLKPAFLNLRDIGKLTDLTMPSTLVKILEKQGIKTLVDIRAAGGLSKAGLPDTKAIRRARLALEAHADLSSISPNLRINAQLVENGFTSPAVIARTPRDNFVAKLSPNLPETEITKLHSLAGTQNRLLNHATAEHIISGSSMVSSSESESPSDRACQCEDCQSAVSPGSYLTDLMDYAFTHLQYYWPGDPNPGLVSLEYLNEILYQSFDKLPLSCESSEEKIRQVRLCIETIRKYLANQPDLFSNNPAPEYPIKFAFAGDVDGDGRDEVIIAPDWLSPDWAVDRNGNNSKQESNALWVMDLDPDTNNWKHLSPVAGHPFEADVVCAPYPYTYKFGFAADVDGDDRAELVLAIAKEGETRNEFWIMKYDITSKQWKHLSQALHSFNADLDPSGAVVSARYAVAADVDGDHRDELIIALDRPGVEGRLFWVMDYDPVSRQWKHLSPIANHPLNADLDPDADDPGSTIQAAFIVPGDFDGDGRVELAINLLNPNSPPISRYFWVLDYDPNLGTGQWTHLRYGQGEVWGSAYGLAAPTPARFGIAVDVDSDGRDELVIGIQDTLGADTNMLRIAKYVYSGAPFNAWLWTDVGTIDCTSKPTHAQSAISVNSDGIAPKEIAVMPIFERGSPDRDQKKNGLWVMQRDAVTKKWNHESPIANHPLDADLDWSKTFSRAQGMFRADVDGNGRDEIVIYPAPWRSLWLMQYDMDSKTWQHFSPMINLVQAERKYRWTAYKMLLNRVGTSFDEIRLARTATDKDRQGLADRIGIPISTPRPDNLDALLLDDSTLNEAKLEEIFGLVDTTRDPFSEASESKLHQWRTAYLRVIWLKQDKLNDAYAKSELPIIDPDIVTPDDFRAFDTTVADTPAALWFKRRTWIDTRLNEFRARTQNVVVSGKNYAVPDLVAMANALKQDSITYDTHQEIVWNSLTAISDLDVLLDQLTGEDKTKAETATKFVKDKLHLTLDSFVRFMDVKNKAQTWISGSSQDMATDSEWSEVYSILAQAIKEVFYAEWLKEESTWQNPAGNPSRQLLSSKYFWPALHEPQVGAWSPVIQTPYIDPELISKKDLPDSASGIEPLEFWKQRQDTLDISNQTLRTEYKNNGIVGLLTAAFGPAPAGLSWTDKIKQLKSDVDSIDPSKSDPAQQFIQTTLHLSIDGFRRLFNLNAALDIKREPTKVEWSEVYVLLTTSLKQRTLYPIWQQEETNKGWTYWNTLKARLPRWRSDPALRQGWVRALADRSQAPIIDPDVITAAYVRSDANEANQLYGRRQTEITARRNILGGQTKDFIGFQAMLLLDDSLGLKTDELDDLINRRANGDSISGRLTQISTAPDAFDVLARIYSLLKNNSPVLADEWVSVYDILTQVWKQRQFADWRAEEIAVTLILSPDNFQLPKRDLSIFPASRQSELLAWRATRRALRNWIDTFQSRIDQDANLASGLHSLIGEVEEATLPILRDALVMASGAPGSALSDKADWLSKRLLIDTRVDGCQVTTRTAQAIVSVQALLWSARTGQLGGLDLKLSAPNFDEEWNWIGSYSTWRAAMFVYLYPENILQPNLRRHQTPVFSQLVRDLRAEQSLTPARARQLAEGYADYWQDVCRLEVKVCAKAKTRITIMRNNQEVIRYSTILYMFAISPISGKVYWSIQGDNSDSGFSQSYWTELPTLKKGCNLIGALSYQTPEHNRFLYLFARTQEEGMDKLVYIKYDLENPNWDGEVSPLELPPGTTRFEAKLKDTDESTRPYLAIKLPNDTLYGRSLSLAGSEWESETFQPIFMQVRSLVWDINPKPIGIKFADLTIADLDQNGLPDMITQRIESDANFDDYFKWGIGANINEDGESQSWADISSLQVPAAFYSARIGSSIAFGNINGNNSLDLLILSVIAGGYGDMVALQYQYMIRWDFGTSHATWSEPKKLPFEYLKSTFLQGTSLAIADINRNGRPDLIIFAIYHANDKENKAYYKIGWDINVNGDVSSWSEFKEIPGWFGASNQGGGIAIADLNGDGRLEMIVFHIDHPNGGNHGYYRIGWNLDIEGNATDWSDVHSVPGWFGNENLDGGIAVADFDNNGHPELVVYHIDNPAGNSAGYYRVGWNLDGQWNQNWRQPCPIPVADYKPIYDGPYEITDQLNVFLQDRRLDIEKSIIDNQNINARYQGTHLTYFEEALYFVPLTIALQLQRSGEYIAALDWFRTIYDYTVPLDQRKIWYGLKQEEKIQIPDYSQRVADWLLDPLNPHLIASMRRNTYTRFTIFSLVKCLFAYADEEFTYDSAESIVRARILYTTALELLNLPELQQGDDQCRALIGWIEQTFLFNHEVPDELIPLAFRLVTEVRGVNNVAILESIFIEIQTATAKKTPWAETLLHLEQFLIQKQADVFREPVPTLFQVLSERPLEIVKNQRAEMARLMGEQTVISSSQLTVSASTSESISSEWIPTITFRFCVAPNPIPNALRLHAELNLYKIRTCRNFAGMKRELEPYAAPTDTQTGLPSIGTGGQLFLPGTTVLRPTPYRFSILIERAKQMVGIAQQIESAFLSALEKHDTEAYMLLKARQDVQLARAGVRLQDLRVTEAKTGVKLAELQEQRAEIQSETYQEWIDGGLLQMEQDMIDWYGSLMGAQIISINAQGVLTGVTMPEKFLLPGAYGLAVAYQTANAVKATAEMFAAVAQANINVLNVKISLERRKQEWGLQKRLADQDILIGAQQINIAEDHVRVVGQERVIAQMGADNAEATVDFLHNKFTNTDLYDWMIDILEGIYRFFLQNATSMAQLASNQLAFERHETPPPYIQSNYWQSPSQNVDNSNGTGGSGLDRRGLTGSARLLQDIYQLDQYAFDNNKRKLQLSKTISLSQLSPVEFQRFRETGVMKFATPLEMFDRDFPGHYLRLIHKVRVSVIALIPPSQGIRASLTASGLSRVVIGGDIYQTILVRRDPQMVALSSPNNATGLFDLDPQSEMLVPFEGMGVDTNWELRMPKVSNGFSYDTLADVLLAIEYTALNSFDYQQQVIQELDTSVSADQAFSFRNQFADQWYDLHNPELLNEAQQMQVSFTTIAQDFPPNLEKDSLKIQHVVLFFARADGSTFEIPVDVLRFTESGSTGSVGGSAASIDGIISTRRGNASSWMPIIGKLPFGTWQLTLPNTETIRDRFKNDEVQDILLVITYSAHTPEWPA